MKKLEVWKWRVRGPTGKVHVTRYVMTQPEALQRDPAAVREPGTLRLLDVPETPAEAAQLMTGSGIHGKPVQPRGWWRQPVHWRT
jgi:hypothetical protein